MRFSVAGATERPPRAIVTVGALRPAKRHKVASDLLKLLATEQALGGAWRKAICFVDATAASCRSGRAWMAFAAKRFKVEAILVDLPESTRAASVAAQARQAMSSVSKSGRTRPSTDMDPLRHWRGGELPRSPTPESASTRIDAVVSRTFSN